MIEKIITGFHAIEELVRKAKNTKDNNRMHILFSKSGPRIKQILLLAKQAGIKCGEVSEEYLDNLVCSLPEALKDHRGIVLSLKSEKGFKENTLDFDAWLNLNSEKNIKATVIILDSITDPHNIGAIIRSCDQFAADLIILPERRGIKEISQNEIIARSSAGASAWVPAAFVSNLVRTVEKLKEKGFWVYAADSKGKCLKEIDFEKRTALIMGSEGKGISRLLKEQCDCTVSIPSCGKIDSLNVSVAAGILLYEIYSRTL